MGGKEEALISESAKNGFRVGEVVNFSGRVRSPDLLGHFLFTEPF